MSPTIHIASDMYFRRTCLITRMNKYGIQFSQTEMYPIFHYFVPVFACCCYR